MVWVSHGLVLLYPQNLNILTIWWTQIWVLDHPLNWLDVFCPVTTLGQNRNHQKGSLSLLPKMLSRTDLIRPRWLSQRFDFLLSTLRCNGVASVCWYQLHRKCQRLSRGPITNQLIKCFHCVHTRVSMRMIVCLCGSWLHMGPFLFTGCPLMRWWHLLHCF